MNASSIPCNRIYDDLADLLPLVAPPSEYAAEAAHWLEVLAEFVPRPRPTVLELGAGGGHNLSHLTAHVEATAVDLSPAVLALCGRLNPGVSLVQGDMRTLRLDKRFDAVLIHDAISYMTSEADLLAAFTTAAAHLERGGVLIVSPDEFADTFTSPTIGHETYTDGARRVTWFEYAHDPDPADGTVETIMTFVVEDEAGVRIEHDRHVTGLFPRATWLALLARAGFRVEARAFALEGLARPYELLVGVLP